ncbi:MAG: hypothetical protein LLG04_02720 [Parachlamydia sp.]|nr:hypothetical protein [Parachlamydia sp.]
MIPVNLHSIDPEIEFNIQPQVQAPQSFQDERHANSILRKLVGEALPIQGGGEERRPHKRKYTSPVEWKLQNFNDKLANFNPLEFPGIRWKDFQALFSDRTLTLQLESGPLTLALETGPWKSWACREEDQLWPEKAPTGQNYDYIHLYSPEMTYFKIRRGLKGRVAELVSLNKGTLIKGKPCLDLCMRIINYLNFERVFLNDDSFINETDKPIERANLPLNGKNFPLEIRVFKPIVCAKKHTLYSDVGFVLWDNNPPVAHDGSKLEPQCQRSYEEAVDFVRNTKLSDIKKLQVASDKQITQLKKLCVRYSIDYEDATVHTLGAAISSAFKIPEAKENATKDFRTFYQACLFASDSPKAEKYNAALDILVNYKYWIKTRQIALQESVQRMLYQV